MFLNNTLLTICLNPGLNVITRNDSQRQFLAQHSVAMLKQYCNYSKQFRNAVLRIVSSNITFRRAATAKKSDRKACVIMHVQAAQSNVLLIKNQKLPIA